MADVDEGLVLHWTYWPASERGFTVENATPETEFADSWLQWASLSNRDPRLEFVPGPDADGPIADGGNWSGWLLKRFPD